MADEVARTWDGQPISSDPPTGTAIVVYRRGSRGVEYLLLHRAQHGPDFEGEWAWGPPSGCRYPGEAIDRCAARELWEETGLRLPLRATALGNANWVVYVVEAPAGSEVRLSEEHDRYCWLPYEQAIARTTPDTVRQNIILAAALTGDGAPAGAGVEPDALR